MEAGFSVLPLTGEKNEVFCKQRFQISKKSRAKGSTNLSPGYVSNNLSFFAIYLYNYCIHLDSSHSTIHNVAKKNRNAAVTQHNKKRTAHHNLTHEHSTQ